MQDVKALWQILALLVFPSLSFAQATPQTPHWTKENVSGLYLELNDPTTVENLYFRAEGYVVADIGTKNGPIAGPIFKWKIINNKLRITNGKEVFEELLLVSMNSSTVKAKNSSGQLMEFSIGATANR